MQMSLSWADVSVTNTGDLCEIAPQLATSGAQSGGSDVMLDKHSTMKTEGGGG